jgi:hypothetical protein
MKDTNSTKGIFVLFNDRFVRELIFALLFLILAISTCSQTLYATRVTHAPAFQWQITDTSHIYNYNDGQSPASIHTAGETITADITASPGEEITNVNTDNIFVVSFTQHPSNSIVCERGSTSFTVAATGSGGLSYQWQESTNGGSSYNNILASGIYSGVTTATLTLTNAATAMNNYRYRCVVTDNSGSTESNAATLTVNTGPVVQTGNTPHAICANGGGTLTAQFFANQTYQWQVSTNGGANWNSITDGGSYTGSGTDVLFISNAGALNGTLYRYIATATNGCQATSGTDTLHVFQPVINTQPVAATVCLGNAANFTVAANSPVTLSYQWQLGASNINNNAIYSGVTTTSLTITNPTAAMDRQLYRVVVRDTLPCTTNSNQVRLFVIAPPSITAQPQNATICAGLNTSFTVTATSATVSGLAALVYQWQTDNGTNGVTWSNVTSGGTAATLSLSTVTTSMNGYRYRVTVNAGSCGPVTSSPAILTVRSSGTWLGAVDTNWHIAGNWCGGVPVSTTNVLIPNWAPRMPTISNTTGIAYSQSLTIENTAKLTISGGSTSMSGPFDISGTVAYTANGDQPVLPADHGSLEINGSGNKILQVNTGISHNMILGGNAKLVTGINILTMRTGSNPIGGATFTGATSWIVTGNGNSGAVNTGLGGLRFEQADASDGTILFPIGPTSVSYNPAQLVNSGTTDDLTMAVNDQIISGGIVNSGIDRTWLLSEATAGGSLVSLELAWNDPEEQSMFNRALSEVIRSNGTSVVEHSPTDSAIGINPYSRSANSFVALNQFSVASYTTVIALPVKLKSFNAKRLSNTSADITWETEAHAETPLYTVERSADGIHFAGIGTLNGVAQKTNYIFIDKNLSGNVAWYRLQIKTRDGKIVYSRTVQIAGVANTTRMQLRPSVTEKAVTHLYLFLDHKENINIHLIDISGRMLLRRSYRLEKGQHSLPLTIDHLHKGIYYLHITGNPGTVTVLPLIKQ